MLYRYVKPLSNSLLFIGYNTYKVEKIKERKNMFLCNSISTKYIELIFTMQYTEYAPIRKLSIFKS